MKPLFICGMASEANILEPYISKHAVVISAGNRTTLTTRLAVLANDPIQLSLYDTVISFGICGGLNPECKPGWLITDVDLETTSWIAATSAFKSALFNSTHKNGVDMETASARVFASAHNLNFKIVRAIADPADFSLPPAALVPLNRDGTPDIAAIAWDVICHPFQIPDLVKLNGYVNSAYTTLDQWCALNLDHP